MSAIAIPIYIKKESDGALFVVKAIGENKNIEFIDVPLFGQKVEMTERHPDQVMRLLSKDEH